LSLDETKEGDEERSVNGIKVLMGPQEQQNMPASRIDYRKSFWGTGLTIEAIDGQSC